MAKADSQRLYEQLGAPSLVYRHAPSYKSWHKTPPEPWGRAKSVKHEASYLHQTCQSASRVRARWYYSADHPFRQSQSPQEDLEGTGKCRRPAEKSIEINSNHSVDNGNSNRSLDFRDSDDPTSKWNVHLRAVRKVNDVDPLQEDRLADVPGSLSHILDLERGNILPQADAQWMLQSRKMYDQNYAPAILQPRTLQPWLPVARKKRSRIMAQDRMDADLAYLATASTDSIRYAMTTQEDKESKRTLQRKNEASKDVFEHDPADFGNCLSCFACPCKVCLAFPEDRERDKHSSEQSSRGWCLIHPSGELLSRVSISNVILPYGASNKSILISSQNQKKTPPRQSSNELDVDGPIRQIEQCGKWQHGDDRSGQVGLTGIFVARSPSHCTMFSISAFSEEEQLLDNSGKGVRKTSASQITSKSQNGCSGSYNLEEVVRIDLRSIAKTTPSYTPKHITCHPTYGGAYADPTFVILSHSNIDEFNVLHHVVGRDPPLVQKHTIPCLKAISEVDFTSSHPMVLWASAKSYVRPALTRRMQHDRPMLGHGHSLYTIDLRSNDAIYQWSPSVQENLPEGVHSISGIKTEWRKEHTVLVTSASAGKTWEIDGRMTCRALHTWSLANACNDWSATVPKTGIHGAGVLMTQTQHMPSYSYQLKSASPPSSCPLLSIGKNPGEFGFQLYQRPNYLPRFHTRSLECVATPGLGSQTPGLETSVCSSSIFALPDTSNTVFTCGIASLRTSVSELISSQSVGQLGYKQSPEDAICVMTMTNKGDIYAHTLLDCSLDVASKARNFVDLPVGVAVVSVPRENPTSPLDPGARVERTSGTKKYGGLNLYVNLSNTFPVTSDAIVSHTVTAKSDCRPFTTIRLEQLPKYVETKRPVAHLASEGNVQDSSDVDSNPYESVAKVSVRQPGGRARMGCVLTRANTNETVKHEEQSTVELPFRYISEANKGLVSFSDCFHHEKEGMHQRQDINNSRRISDMTSDILDATEILWNNPSKVENYDAVKREDDKYV